MLLGGGYVGELIMPLSCSSPTFGLILRSCWMLVLSPIWLLGCSPLITEFTAFDVIFVNFVGVVRASFI